MPLDPPSIPTASPAPQVSVVVPVFNEAGAAPDLAREIAGAFAGQTVEILFVDDCSRDDTRERLAALKSEIPTLRL
ncbi:MAG: glycosyltransferase, partial [Phenylobacterium sp.]|nr:glycosyltransferase [Phenylobacterium sp.]